MLLPSLLHIGSIIFATHGKYHTVVLELKQSLLPPQKGIAGIVAPDFNAFNALFAEHATPKRVVEVKHQAFLSASPQFFLNSLPPLLKGLGNFGAEQRL